MKPEEVFLTRLDQLRRFARTPNPGKGEVLDSANHLRLLLLDGLATTVNAEIRVPLLFHVHQPRDQLGIVVEYNADPFRAPGSGSTMVLKLAQFRKHPVLIGRGQKHTVEDVIRVVANSLGGSHVGMNKTPSAEALRNFDQFTVSIDGGAPQAVQMSMSLIQPITERTVSALEVLRSLVALRSW